jgi:PAS domain S-box-containing protein
VTGAEHRLLIPLIPFMPHRFRTLFQYTADAVFLSDGDGVVIEVNPAATARFGLAADASAHLRDLLADPGEWPALADELMRGDDVLGRSVRVRCASGETELASLTCVQMRGGPGGQIQAIIHSGDHPALEALDELYDVQTGLPNRRAFVAQLTRALSGRQGRAVRQIAVIHVDLNRFQRINQTLGHETGDTVLSMTAQRRMPASAPATWWRGPPATTSWCC